MSRVFGAIPKIPVGSLFRKRRDLAEAGVHRPLQAGISGAGKEGAESVVLSGGYEDDQDYGDVVIYTGHGGKDPHTRQQIADQELTRGNLALAPNQAEGVEVRLIRGSGLDSPFAPADGYRYDGLYCVDDHWHERGRAGFLVWRFRLRSTDQPALPTRSGRSLPAARRQVTSSRVIRDSALIRRVKNFTTTRAKSVVFAWHHRLAPMQKVLTSAR
jgi:putative restriction endonuclease